MSVEIVGTLTKEEEAVTLFLTFAAKAIAKDVIAQMPNYPNADEAIEEISSRYFSLAKNAVQFHVGETLKEKR